MAGEHTHTASGRIRKLELDQICRWIHEAWEEIPARLIQKAFCKCCITNALDGTEDDQMWDDDDDSDPFPNVEEDETEGDEHLFYTDSYEHRLAEIDIESYQNLFGESDSEEFYGF